MLVIHFHIPVRGDNPFFPLRRAVAQRCPSPPMINLISIGGQHQGNLGSVPLFFCFNPHDHLIKKKIIAALFIQEVSQPSLQNSVGSFPPAPTSNKLTSILEEIGRYLGFHRPGTQMNY